MQLPKPAADFDITIIGGGPTGLFSALLAREQGLSVCILEQREGPLPIGRADALNARTQQVYEVADVLKYLRPKGLKCNTSSVFKDGKFVSHNNTWWVSLENSQYKEFLMIGQPEIEKALLKRLDVGVRYGVTAESITESAEGVEVRVVGDKGVIRSRYLVAADGAHSACRKQLGIGFAGDMPNMCWAVLDTFLETDFPVCDEIVSFEVDGQSRVSWIPRERGMARFYVLLEGEVTQEKTQQSISQHMAPYKVVFKETEWFSTYNVQERVAEAFVSRGHGRVILAGDAAHVHAVNGGQGLNTGAADAFALAWRLKLAISGFNTQVLQIYDAERRATAKGVVDVAAKLVRTTLKTAEEYVALIGKNAANITGMGITYAPSSAAVVASSVGAFVAGARTPDFVFAKAKVVEIRFYELLRYGNFVVLNPQGLALDLPQSLDAHVDVWEVSKRDTLFEVKTAAGAILTTSFDLGQDLTSAIVIRPDLYTGYVGTDVLGYFKGFVL
ncbi:uncharacterized protein L3040_003038 [Drepanopeziza brunnea f. sp. 'multigermtubi']|uniref:uncharacterized protein n=1 Tax=Drepanopeziza brunnea f. sp. 'multigermtubi' TaxID=698441 RepID=UPI002388A5F3|nr:hypothetical protein L3040_003038 [Drepanopeziza brunnea f. sp. 'multigermtubi']